MNEAERILALKPDAAPPSLAISPELVADLKRDEGVSLTAYQDTCSRWTIGYGHAGPEVCKGMTWTSARAETMLLADIAEAQRELDAHLPWWRSLNPTRADALTELVFNMGIENLVGFKNTLAALKAGDFKRAAAGILASRYAVQVGKRATRIAQMIASGERPAKP